MNELTIARIDADMSRLAAAKAEKKDILNCFLGQIMINPKNLLLFEVAV